VAVPLSHWQDLLWQVWLAVETTPHMFPQDPQFKFVVGSVQVPLQPIRPDAQQILPPALLSTHVRAGVVVHWILVLHGPEETRGTQASPEQ
jgi:hypothetical protein